MTKRQDTKLEANGAEFLVLGQLLIRGMQAYKSYLNNKGYDLITVNPEKKTQAKIEVKSRYHTNMKSFPIKNFESDFVVFCSLNRGSKKIMATSILGIKEPEYYIFPTILCKNHAKGRTWKKFHLSDVNNFEQYKNNWDLIFKFLNKKGHRI